MNHFTFYNPTTIFFGENAVRKLGAQLKPYRRVLLVYGGGSIKKNGIYDDVLAALREAECEVYELAGVMPNPRTEKVYAGIEICKKNDVDFILAVGGGSAIDCAKAIAAGAKTEKDFWQAFYIDKEKAEAALPVGAVLTMAGTGSEMNASTVISKWDENMKQPYNDAHLYPKFSILDPTYTYSLPVDQMVYGAVDILSHLFEVYFSAPDASCLSDDMNEGVMKNVVENLNAALENPRDYTARANLMWCSTMAINGLLRLSKKGDWQAHQIGHALSAYYDIAHGASLSIAHPYYMEYTYKAAPEKYARYARSIWHVDPAGKTEEEIALEGIEKTRAYFKKIGAPTTLTEAGIPAGKIDEIAAGVRITGTGYMSLTTADIAQILKNSIE